MKNIIVLLLVVIMVATLFCGCNRQIFDVTYSFEYAYVKLPNGECVEGVPSSWRDYENSDMVQVVINGKTYLTHSTNVVMVSDQGGR